jgi:hypothetical protein
VKNTCSKRKETFIHFYILGTADQNLSLKLTKNGIKNVVQVSLEVIFTVCNSYTKCYEEKFNYRVACSSQEDPHTHGIPYPLLLYILGI